MDQDLESNNCPSSSSSYHSSLLSTGPSENFKESTDGDGSCCSQESTITDDEPASESDVMESVDESDIECSDEDHDESCLSLYDNAEISVLESHLLCFQFAIRHSLTAKAFTELLQLISVHLPSSSKAPKSVHQLKKFFVDLFPHAVPTVYTYCSFCLSLLTEEGLCSTDGCQGHAKEKFISIPLKQQLKRIMEDPESWCALQVRFGLPDYSGVIRDVYDGDSYRHHSAFLSKPTNVSLLLNTDGVSIFNSSTISIWPVWVQINELPKSARFKRRNMLLAGMWFSKEKPRMNVYLRPFIDEINEIYVNDIDVCTPNGTETCKAILLQCSADLPGRAILTNTKHFNGKWGCLYCTNPGTTDGVNHLHRYWPHRPSVLRTNESLLEDATLAVREGNAVNGVVGPTVLSLHPCIKLAWAVVIDDLHCLYIGISKQLLHLWFDNVNRTKDFYIGKHVKLCDGKLLKICVPDCISRVPKSLQDIAHWKGSEMRNWLLFYSLPVLSGVLQNPYLSHLSLLVAGLLILSSNKITQEDIENAKQYLDEFYLKFPDLYGEGRTTMNVHLVSHLVDCVKRWGPLWAYSCFVYETMNGHLKRLFHGTRNMSEQMAFSYIASQNLFSLLTKLEDSCPRVTDMVHILLNNKRIRKQELCDNMALVGACALLFLDPHIVDLSNSYLQRHSIEAVCSSERRERVFYRIEINSQLYFSARYDRVKARNTYTVLYRNTDGHKTFGLIQ